MTKLLRNYVVASVAAIMGSVVVSTALADDLTLAISMRSLSNP